MGIKNLLEENPELAAEAHGWDASAFSHKSGLIKTWKGLCGHIWDAEIKNRSRGQGCPYCSNKKIINNYNDLATTHPSIAEEAFDWDPTTVTSGSDKKKCWKGKCGHVWQASVKTRTKKNPSGCPYCSNKKLLIGFNDLKSKNPQLASEALGWNPELFMAGSHQKKSWKASCGHTWECQIKSRSNGSGCPFCAGIKVLKGFNDLLTKWPKVAQEAYLWDPALFSATSSKKMPFKCSNCQHIWNAEIRSRTTRNFTNCPNCTLCGFKKNKISYVYLIEKQQLRKIGIGNKKSKRIQYHVKNGWKIIDIIENIFGHEAAIIEYKILKYISGINVPMGIYATKEKFNGFSECWLASSCKVNKISKLLELANKISLECP